MKNTAWTILAAVSTLALAAACTVTSSTDDKDAGGKAGSSNAGAAGSVGGAAGSTGGTGGAGGAVITNCAGQADAVVCQAAIGKCTVEGACASEKCEIDACGNCIATKCCAEFQACGADDKCMAALECVANCTGGLEECFGSCNNSVGLSTDQAELLNNYHECYALRGADAGGTCIAECETE